MLQSTQEALEYMDSGPSLLGPGWREVSSFEDVSDEDDYTSDEEELYAVLDFEQSIDRQTLQTESTYQLIGIDTPVPFLKIGNQVFQGEMTPLIGDEVILGMVRNPSNPAKPSHPPIHTSSHHLTFRPVTLFPKNLDLDPAAKNGEGSRSQSDKPGRGRPKGVTTRPKVIVNTEEEIQALDIGSLPDNIIIEIQKPPETPDGPPGEILRLSKAQAERIAIGLPLKGKGSRGGTVRRPRETAQGEGSTKAKGKGRRGKSATETPIPEEPDLDEEGDVRPPDIDMGGVTLSVREPEGKKTRKKKAKKSGLGTQVAGPSVETFTGEAVPERADGSGAVPAASAEGDGDLEIPASPLMEVGSDIGA